MKKIEIISRSREETMRLGNAIALQAGAGDIICLFGDLGSGKTTLVKGMAKGLKINPTHLNSPTFVLFNIYEGKLPLYHFDLYRLEKAREILNLGYEEYFYGKGVTVVEWAERLNNLLPEKFLRVELFHQNNSERLIKISAQGDCFKNLKKYL